MYLGVFDSKAYKCILGMDILAPLNAWVKMGERTLELSDTMGKRFLLSLRDKTDVKHSA